MPSAIRVLSDLSELQWQGVAADRAPVWDGSDWVATPLGDFGVASADNLVIVDPNGAFQFTTVGEAITYVAGQARSDTMRWLVRVNPGRYTENPFTVPTYTSVYSPAGVPGQGATHTILDFSAANSGNLVTLSQYASIFGLTLQYYKPSGQTGDVSIVYSSSNNTACRQVYAYGVASSAFHLNGFHGITSGTFFEIFEADAEVYNFGAGEGRGVFADSSITRLGFYNGRSFSEFPFVCNGGTMRVTNSLSRRTGSFDFKRTGGTLEVGQCIWTAHSGTITLIGEGNIYTDKSATATTLGSVVRRMPIYNLTGTLLGYMPIYDSIT